MNKASVPEILNPQLLPKLGLTVADNRKNETKYRSWVTHYLLRYGFKVIVNSETKQVTGEHCDGIEVSFFYREDNKHYSLAIEVKNKGQVVEDYYTFLESL